jgi:cytochrome oxidase Cu insertion factor (SCO1/SenC/PrrC family)
MVLRGLATLILLAFLALNAILPTSSFSHRGSEDKVRADIVSRLIVGRPLPPLELVGFDGRIYTREDLDGHRVLLTFERSVDW